MPAEAFRVRSRALGVAKVERGRALHGLILKLSAYFNITTRKRGASSDSLFQVWRLIFTWLHGLKYIVAL